MLLTYDLPQTKPVYPAEMTKCHPCHKSNIRRALIKLSGQYLQIFKLSLYNNSKLQKNALLYE